MSLPYMAGYQQGSNHYGYGSYYDKSGKSYQVSQQGYLYQIDMNGNPTGVVTNDNIYTQTNTYYSPQQSTNQYSNQYNYSPAQYQPYQQNSQGSAPAGKRKVSKCVKAHKCDESCPFQYV